MNTILTQVRAALDSVPSSPLHRPLWSAFTDRPEALAEIEGAFQRFTSRRFPAEQTRTFVHSWSLTNHSAMCVSGISNRLTLLLRNPETVADRARLVDAVVSLNRISDEDLGVGGGTLHADLFYDMGEMLCGDDAWMSRRYAIPAAHAYREYKNRAGLRAGDLMHGLLSTVVHEIYTHGEVEFILPLFRSLAESHLHLDRRQRARRLAWIAVHCGGTERNHFAHAIDACLHYGAAVGADLDAYDMNGMFAEYIEKKAAVMQALARVLDEQGVEGGASAAQAG